MNKLTAILLIGLPCSGKSTFAQKLNRHNIYEVIDDFTPPKGEAKDLVLADKLEICRKNQTNLIFCDINFCVAEIREKAKSSLHDIGYTNIIEFFFENDTEKCNNNLEYRLSTGDKRTVTRAISLYSKLYKIPENAIRLKIWQNNNN